MIDNESGQSDPSLILLSHKFTLINFYSQKLIVMKRKKLLLLSALLLGLCLTVFAQEPKLIFSEVATPSNGTAHYYEFTNMEASATIDLREFTFKHYGWWHQYPLGGNHVNTNICFRHYLDDSNAFLAPGESFVVCGRWEGKDDDGYPTHRQGLVDIAGFHVYANEAWDEDVVDDSASLMVWFVRNPNGEEGKALWWHSSPTDSVMVDAIDNWIDPATNSTYRNVAADVAGVEAANRTHILVRKANITQGNTDWNSARGTDLSDSEWMPVPYDPTNNWNPVVYSSVGNHGVYDISMESKTPGKLVFDHNAGTITMPWGVRKGTWDVTGNHSQGIFDEIVWGNGMAWNYVETTSDTASAACQTGDTLNVYAFGNTLIHKAYKIIVEDAAVDNALALPTRAFDDEFYMSYLHGSPFGPGESRPDPTPLEDRRLLQQFEITENIPVMDTIMNLPYAVRKDTLLSNIEIAPNASSEFIFVDGMERVDLMEGDILRVTAENGTTTKDYYLSIEHISKSTNAFLSAITWPDVPEYAGWMNGDTIPGFDPGILAYTVTVPFGTTSVPALSYFKSSLNSTVIVERATTLNGAREDMTTTITVTSQDTTETDIEQNVYSITFEMEKLYEHLQPYTATPIISEIVWRICQAEAAFIEISNVGNQPLNLENYMFQLAASAGTPAEVLARNASADTTDWVVRYRKYIPGFKWGTFEEWKSSPMTVLPDPNVDPIVEPGGTFIMGRFNHLQFDPETPGAHMYKYEEVDIHWSQFLENDHGEMDFNYNQTIPFTWCTNSIMVFKILNPAVLEGTKPPTDPADFELVDLWGDYVQGANWLVAGRTWDNGFQSALKPHAWRPNLEQQGGWGTNEDDSDWTVMSQADPDVQWNNDIMSQDLGNYSHDPITIYMSTVTSKAYIVDPGFIGDLNISGVPIGSTADEMMGNIIKADTGQDLSVISATTGLVLEGGADITDGDTLMVVSEDMVNTTKYLLGVSAGGLDDNAELTSTELTITTGGETGTIEGIAMGSTIAEVLDMVVKPELAVLNVVDKDNNLVPLQILNPDTLMVSTVVMGELYFEVVAQNQTTIIRYELVLDISASDAWVTSNIYDVAQENFVISLVPEGVLTHIFLENLVPSGNATIELLDKAEFKRDSGYVVEDDILRVTSEDQSMYVDYSIRFLGAPLRTLAYVTSDVYTVDETLLGISDIPAGTVVDDFLANLAPAPGAIITLLDGSDNVKVEGVVTSDDKVKVVAEDEETEVFYALDVKVSARDMMANGISIYPNPVSDVLFITGLTKGSTIHLTSITGQKIKVIEAVNDPVKVSIEGLAKGYYIINVIDSDQNSTLFRFVKN